MSYMQHEIKFRGKSLLSDKWVYGDYFSQYKDGQRRYYIVEHPFGPGGGRDTIWEIKPETVGQYIGCNDKNVYEGDIVERGDETHVIVFEDGSFGYRGPRGYWHHVYEFMTGGINEEGKVIGNITDTPELLYD